MVRRKNECIRTSRRMCGLVLQSDARNGTRDHQQYLPDRHHSIDTRSTLLHQWLPG
ncbi:hypothetical protein Mapa_010546 [Marchantia paleacea]|nr:hypothetical protein Mapa_010546 [Marchantia paleacea]